ncbi:autotransporter outer membrane beta-barrel domain-containing protein [Salmonella enterica subsp. enterica serovar Saintpaul]|nr:autotransporter outer membrane beta-barrel domain-containing protein [Salmonella enterica subsp. enterica serovar Saintpaul]
MNLKTKPLFLTAMIATIYHSNAIAFTEIVSAGDTVDGEYISNDGPELTNNQDVYGIANNTIVGGDGYQTVQDGGVANSTSVLNGGGVSVVSGGVINESYVGGSSSMLLEGGSANNSDIKGYLQNTGGVDSFTTVGDGGRLFVSNGVSENATIESGGQGTVAGESSEGNNWNINGDVEVNQGATMNNTTVSTGGTLTVGGASIGGYGDKGVINDTTVNGGHVQIGGKIGDGNEYTGEANNITLNSGEVVVGSKDSNVSGVIQTGGKLRIQAGSVNDLNANAGVAILSSNEASLTNSTIQGEGHLLVENGTLDGAHHINGGSLTVSSEAVTDSADIFLADGGAVSLAGDPSRIPAPGTRPEYAFNDVSMDGGSVHFQNSTYSTLTLNSLSGEGSFYMNTSLAEQTGDFLNVTNEASGNFDVYVADTGKSPVSPESLQIIQTGGGDASFTLANTGGVVDLGTYEYHLTGEEGNSWSLTPAPVDPVEPPVDPVEPPVGPIGPLQITPSTAAVLSMAAVDPLVFNAELSSVRHRLGETRSFSHDTNVWSDVYNTRNDVSTDAGAGFDQNLSGITLGADRSDRSEHGITTRGVFVGYSHSNVDFDRGGKGNVDSYSVGAYASYLHDDGYYIDGILKANRFENDVNGKMTGGGAADGYYHTNGAGLHIQGGKYFHFDETYVAPYVAVTGFTSDSSDYALSNGMQAHVGSTRSLMAEGGVNVGHKFTLNNGAVLQPYVGVAATQEFIDDNKVEVNNDGHFENDLSGTRGVYQVGLRAQLTDRLTAHADASYAQGSNIESPWVANIGVAWSF